jgi:hypothetical protein
MDHSGMAEEGGGTHKRQGEVVGEREHNDWGEHYCKNPGRGEFKIGVAVVSNGAEAQTFGNCGEGVSFLEVRVETGEQSIEERMGREEEVSEWKQLSEIGVGKGGGDLKKGVKGEI